jgi:type IV secretory pathway VirB2 component (pilin)
MTEAILAVMLLCLQLVSGQSQLTKLLVSALTLVAAYFAADVVQLKVLLYFGVLIYGFVAIDHKM